VCRIYNYQDKWEYHTRLWRSPPCSVAMDSHRASFSDMGDGSNAHTSEQLTAHDQPPHDSVTTFVTTPSRSLNTKKAVTPIPANLLPSAPASPPTPAPSPTPHQRSSNWPSTDDEENSFLLNLRLHFSTLSNARKHKLLEGLLDVCDSQQLSFVSSYVAPRLRKDPFQVFPNELCLRVRYLVECYCTGLMLNLI
jgi:F-box and WD-40 domain protein CDC4